MPPTVPRILAARGMAIEEGRQGAGRQWRISPSAATTGDNGFVIDRAKAEEDAKFDGIFVLRTSTDLGLEAMFCYKQLTMVEQVFRTAETSSRRVNLPWLIKTIRGGISSPWC